MHLARALTLAVVVAGSAASTGRSAEQSKAAKWASAMVQQRQIIARDRANLPQQTTWFVTRPIAAKTFDTPCFPEKEINLNANAPDGKPLWTPKPDWQDAHPNPISSPDNTATYLFRTIQCPTAMRLTASVGSDDGITVWLNGKKIHANNVPRVVNAGQDLLTLDLMPGNNDLLIRIYNISGGCGFYYSLGHAKPASLNDLTDAFPDETRRFSRYFLNANAWITAHANTALERAAIERLLTQLNNPSTERAQLAALVRSQAAPTDPAWLTLFASLAQRAETIQAATASLKTLNFASLEKSILELASRYPDKYRNAPAHLRSLNDLRKQAENIPNAAAAKDDHTITHFLHAYENLKWQALVLDNPLVDFQNLLVVKRDAQRLGLPQNWQGNSSIDPHMQNEVAQLDIKSRAALKRVYKPARPVFVGDLCLHFDGQKLLFSSIGDHGRWQVFEMLADGSNVRQVTSSEYRDIDNYNAIYLPDGRIIFCSTATFLGVPCVGGADHVANLYLLSADRKTTRQLSFEQDNDWYPTLLHDGRVMYLRWEYTDSAHYFSRLLMSMNPDGTGQIEYYGSNSYWPNSVFYAKPVPNSTTKFVGIVSGHHGVPRMGELVLFDQTRGRKEHNGAVQRIPGHGQVVQDKIVDSLVDDSWPKFLHPTPLSDAYFLVSCKPNPQANWGVYLVDVFDNLVLIKEEPGYALLEPTPLRKTQTPPAIPDKVKLDRKTAIVSIQDIYTGQGLPGVPRGTVKSLRIFQYEYSYRNMGGHYAVGIEGPWDVRRLIGTVPVHPDGSALFEIPANTPVSLQPLDAEGKAIQQKRSWFVGMPGEHVSCGGCHDVQNNSVPVKPTKAMQQPPAQPQDWYGPKRGFSFLREVQPTLDKYCVGCHNGQNATPNLADTTITRTSMGAAFPKSYIALHPFVRRNGPEGNYHLLTPMEFHADTSDLVQILNKGHYNVQLDKEAWDRFITWIDLNVPAHGTWREVGGIPSDFKQRRYETRKLFAGVDEDIEAVDAPYKKTEKFIAPPPMPPKPSAVSVDGWPFSPEKARQMQGEPAQSTLQLNLGNDQFISLRLIPAGQFQMGDLNGYPDEYPTATVRIHKPFWIASTEISLQQYQQYDPLHRNGYYDMHYKDQVKPGYLMDNPKFPAIRVSWHEAMAFCKWLSQKTGKNVSLPTEAQWEWACRAGTSTPFWFGNLNSDFSAFANLGDRSLKKLAVSGVDPQPIANPDSFWDFVPKDDRFDDGVLHLATIGKYAANPWGLRDMHGNAAEWTRSTYQAYPYEPSRDTHNDGPTVKKTVRGGSWYDRPKHARSAFRQAYPPWQKVYNVGFRIVVED